MDEAAEIALEDYARVVTGARAAEARRAGSSVQALHLCGLAGAEPAALRDLEDFARELAATCRRGPG